MYTEYTLKPYTAKDKTALLAVWEASVLATHHFVKAHHFSVYKDSMAAFDLAQFNTVCVFLKDELVGFIAVNGFKVEMLFLHPHYRRLGLGSHLISFAKEHFKAVDVDVNAQNTNAVAFYEQCGFEVIERTEVDGFGFPYPLLKMKLKA